jgi:uncharacterized UPF0160 family protein
MENIPQNKDLIVLSTESLEAFIKQNSFFESIPNQKIVGTHSGCFHADEVLSVAMIKYIPEFKNMWIIRSRNKDILGKADIVVDVGGKYEPENFRFDHHMRDFKHVHDEVYKIKLSSAGLIFKHFGKTIIENALNYLNAKKNINNYNEITNENSLNNYFSNKTEDTKNLELNLIYDKLYYNLIAYVDAQDNGIAQYPENVTAKYANNTSYPNRVSRLNPEWCEPQACQSERFKLALDVAESEFLDQLRFIAFVYMPAFTIVKEAFEKRFDTHSSGKLLYFDFGFPWKSHLKQIEEERELKDDEKVLFAIVKNSPEDYRLTTIPIAEGSFKFRKGIAKNWRGLELAKLAEVSGIDDIIFVHTSGFIGGAKTKESVFKMAEVSFGEKDEE